MLDGAIRVKDLAKRVKSLGQRAVARTDHGRMHGTLQLTSACAAEGIQAIVGWYPHVALQASGGVATLDDLALLLQSGADGAIVGKALWEGRFTVEQALKAAGA